jgi:hypothetical protein
MSDDDLLLDHARRYFTQAGQASDIKKMRMLAELGLEFISLAQHGGRRHARAGTPIDATDASPPDRGESGKVDD